MESRRVEEEYQAFKVGNLWPLIYQRIGTRCQAYTYTCVEAKKTTNKPLNRYRDVNPYDHSRIILQKEGFVTDYINANLVKMERADRQYILTQGPLVYTSGHFWLMVWEQNSPAIIMLNKIVEKSEVKCHSYWPREDGDSNKVVYPDVNMSITLLKEYDYSYYTIRRLKLHNQETDEARELWHFHYTTWPDFEVPQSPHAFLDFLKRVREYGALDCEGEKGPAIVHCSAGIGRSGTFCLVDSVLVLIENEGQANVDIQEILLELRRYRMGLIQTSEQLRFSYIAIVEGIKRLDPNYVPPVEPLNESIYSSVADEEEAPPPPPPRGASLGRPPARPLPAIPASASMATGANKMWTRVTLMETMTVFERRRARARVIVQSAIGGVPTLASLAAAVLQPQEIPAHCPAAMPSLARLAMMDVLTLPTEPVFAATVADKMWSRVTLMENSIFERRRARARLIVESANGGVPTLASLVAAAAGLQPLEVPAHQPAAMPSLARLAMMDVLTLPTELVFAAAVADELSRVALMETTSIFARRQARARLILQTAFGGVPTLAAAAGLQPQEIPAHRPAAVPRLERLAAMVVLTLPQSHIGNFEVESDESDVPPTPPPRDGPPSGLPSPALSGHADDDSEDNSTTESSTPDTVESVGGGLRRRRAALLAERVASMKKRSRDADRWHQLKRSLLKPIALSVGVGLLTAVGIFIYTYSKH